MGYEELFPGMDTKWHTNATKRFATPFVDVPHDRIDVDPIILSHAAVACGFTIRDFYEKPELGIHCVGYISHLYDLLPVTHWFYSLPWVRELGLTLQYKDTLPPISTGPIITEPGQVDNIHVPDVDELLKGHTLPEFIRMYEYVAKNLPMTLVPIAYGFDLVGGAAELCGAENFIMWTFTEREAAHKLVKKFTDTAINGAVGTANKFGMAMMIIGSVLANNDIFSDEDVKAFGADYMKYYVDQSFRRGAGPQLFYHLCGNHQTDYKVFKDTLFWSPFTVIHIGYSGRDVFPSSLLKEEFGNRATIMGSVDTKLMINPNPKVVYEQSKAQILAGRDTPKGYILGTACETPPYTIPGNLLAMVKAARDVERMGHGEVRQMDVKIPDQVKEVLGKRGIKEADVEDVVKTAESTSKKLVVKGTTKSIAKKRIGNVTVYAVYDIDGLLKKHANLESAYSHRMSLGKIVNSTDPTNYVCVNCNAPATYGHVEMEYMTVKRNGPAVVCTVCGDSWVEEFLATKTLAAAEGLFEKKRA